MKFAVQTAAEHGQSEAGRVLRIFKDGVSRRRQLDRYLVKKKDSAATFRPYAPLKASGKTRVELKRRAQAEGVAPEGNPICGFENLRGERCWLAPHRADVAHQF